MNQLEVQVPGCSNNCRRWICIQLSGCMLHVGISCNQLIPLKRSSQAEMASLSPSCFFCTDFRPFYQTQCPSCFHYVSKSKVQIIGYKTSSMFRDRVKRYLPPALTRRHQNTHDRSCLYLKLPTPTHMMKLDQRHGEKIISHLVQPAASSALPYPFRINQSWPVCTLPYPKPCHRPEKSPPPPMSRSGVRASYTSRDQF
jgi:hypothetical protein